MIRYFAGLIFSDNSDQNSTVLEGVPSEQPLRPKTKRAWPPPTDSQPSSSCAQLPVETIGTSASSNLRAIRKHKLEQPKLGPDTPPSTAEFGHYSVESGQSSPKRTRESLQVPSPAEFVVCSSDAYSQADSVHCGDDSGPSMPKSPRGQQVPSPIEFGHCSGDSGRSTPQRPRESLQVPSPAEYVVCSSDSRCSGDYGPSMPKKPRGQQAPSPTEFGHCSSESGRSTPQRPRENVQVPSPAEFGHCSSNSGRSMPKRKIDRKSLQQKEIEFLVNYGSDDCSDGSDDEAELPFMSCPRVEQIIWQQLEDFEEANADDLTPATAGSPPATVGSSPAITGSPPARVGSPPVSAGSPLAAARSPPAMAGSPPAAVEGGSLHKPDSLFEFNWEPLPQPPLPWQERREVFSGAGGPTDTFSTPYDAFVSIWNREIMEKIAFETNKYAEQTLQKQMDTGTLSGYSRLLRFSDTNADELYTFFALILATGIVFKADLTEYWSVNGDIFDTPNFGKYMTYNRFFLLGQMLHFTDNSVDISHLSGPEAKVHKIAPILDHLNEKFQLLYQLGQCVALDESLTQWAGWLSINQFIKNKAASKGVKTYEVCDSRSGYLWRFKVHAGRQDEDTDKDGEIGYITSLVLQLLQGLEYRGHTIFMDNFYNSPTLARLLKSLGFDCVGTLRQNRRLLPQEVSTAKKQTLPPGGIVGATSGDVDVMVWRDKSIVTLISTYHGLASSSRDGRLKPTLVHDYNTCMGGVDKKDQMLSLYPIERKRTAVWYKKLFRRFLNVSVLNAYILHKDSPVPEHPHPRITKQRLFRKVLVNTLLEKHAVKTAEVRMPSKSTFAAPYRPEAFKFTEEMRKHLPAEYPYNAKLKQRQRRTCAVCRKRTQTLCPGCNMPLCIGQCFSQYH